VCRRDEEDVVQESRRLQAAVSKEVSEKLYGLQEARRKLPAYKQKTEVVAAMQQHQVVVVSGATGGPPPPSPSPLMKWQVFISSSRSNW